MSLPEVLGISKRTAALCANQPLLHAAGLQLRTSIDVGAALSSAESKTIRGIIICHDSWSDAERKTILSALKSSHVPLMHCPGCAGCDEATATPGTLDLLLPLTALIERMSERN